jgi:hypothetical protein
MMCVAREGAAVADAGVSSIASSWLEMCRVREPWRPARSCMREWKTRQPPQQALNAADCQKTVPARPPLKHPSVRCAVTMLARLSSAFKGGKGGSLPSSPAPGTAHTPKVRRLEGPSSAVQRPLRASRVRCAAARPLPRAFLHLLWPPHRRHAAISGAEARNCGARAPSARFCLLETASGAVQRAALPAACLARASMHCALPRVPSPLPASPSAAVADSCRSAPPGPLPRAGSRLLHARSRLGGRGAPRGGGHPRGVRRC